MFQLGDRVRYTEEALASFNSGYRLMMQGVCGTIRRDQGFGYFAVLWDGRDEEVRYVAAHEIETAR